MLENHSESNISFVLPCPWRALPIDSHVVSRRIQEWVFDGAVQSAGAVRINSSNVEPYSQCGPGRHEIGWLRRKDQFDERVRPDRLRPQRMALPLRVYHITLPAQQGDWLRRRIMDLDDEMILIASQTVKNGISRKDDVGVAPHVLRKISRLDDVVFVASTP